MGATVFFESATELATLTNTFKVGSTPTDPDAVTLVVTSPTGTSTTYTWPSPATITRSSAGVFTKDIGCSEDGVWQYVWTGTGAAADVTAGTWTVHASELQKLYCTPEELKSRIGISDTLDDAEIIAACEAVSRWIDGHCDRYFWRGTATRTYAPCGLYEVKVDDLVSVTSLKTDAAGDGTFETTWSASDYQLLPVNPSVGPETRPYTRIRAVGANTFPVVYTSLQRADRVEVAGVFGWSAVPSAVKQAAAILSADFLQLGQMKFGVAGFGEFGVVRARNNPIVMSLLAPYRRYPVLVA